MTVLYGSNTNGDLTTAAIAAGATTVTLTPAQDAKYPAIANGDTGELVLASADESAKESPTITGHVVGSNVLTISPTTLAWPVGSKMESRQSAAKLNAQNQSLSAVASAPAIPAFSTSVTYPVGAQVRYAGGFYQFTAAHAGQWTGADATYLGQVDPISQVNTIGVMSPIGMQQNSYPGAPAATAKAATANNLAFKINMEALAYRVKVMLKNKSPFVSRGYAASFAATELESVGTTFTLSQCYDPIVGGTAYSVLASAANPYGFRQATWGNGSLRSGRLAKGSATTVSAGYITDSAIIASDWVPVKQVANATTPGGRPLLVGRISYPQNAGDSVDTQNTSAIIYNIVNKFLTPVAPLTSKNGRLLYLQNIGSATDAVVDPTGAKTGSAYNPATGGAWLIPMMIAMDHAIPTRNFYCIGDSITENFNWLSDAISSLSSQTAPCYFYNYGMSSNTMNQIFSAMKQTLLQENYATDIVIPSWSINDGLAQFTEYTLTTYISRLDEAIIECQKRGLRLYIWTNYNGSGTFFTRLNNWVIAQGQAGRCRVIDINTNFASTATAAYNAYNAANPGQTLIRSDGTIDGTHPSTIVMQAYMSNLALAAFQGA